MNCPHCQHPMKALVSRVGTRWKCLPCSFRARRAKPNYKMQERARLKRIDCAARRALKENYASRN